MFEPERVLQGLPLATMTPAELLDAINRIATRAHKRASYDYYNQLLGAIATLAQLAAERLEAGEGGQE
jgi:hypothetical protein